MALTRDFKETVNARVQRDSEFAIALLNEAISLFLNGEPETARLILRAEMLNVVTKLYIFKYSSIIKGKNVNIS